MQLAAGFFDFTRKTIVSACQSTWRHSSLMTLSRRTPVNSAKRTIE
jgi:hypothetical protein